MLHKKQNRRTALALALFAGPLAAVHCQINDNGPAAVDVTSPAGDIKIFYPTPAGLDKSRLLLPANLEYRGAFKLPTAANGGSSFSYVAGAMAWYPKGDPSGAADGHFGSLFVAGHVQQMYVGEVDIPKPALPNAAKDLSSLPTAKVLNPLRKIGTRPSGANPVMAIGYLPAQGAQAKDKLFVSIGDGYLPADDHKTYYVADMDFTNQLGPYRMGQDAVHCYSDYIFPIPKTWADKYAPGMALITGRHREGDLCGRGPAMFAVGPWSEASPPSVDTRLDAKPVLRYKQDVGLASYSRGGDVYMDGAFLASGGKGAVVFVGQKGLSEGDYGTACGYQGFHDLLGYRPYLMFYDPDELGRAAKGELGVDKPMPYAGLDLNAYLMKPNVAACDKNNITASSYDPDRNLLYLLERNKENPVVHVFQVAVTGVGVKRAEASGAARPLVESWADASLRVSLPADLRAGGQPLEVRVLDAAGRPVPAVEASRGEFERAFTGLRRGLYVVEVKVGDRRFAEKVLLAD